MKRILRNISMLAPVAGLLAALSPATTLGSEGFTLAALRLAYQREINAQRQYQAYAERAWMEGCLGARNLFQALAMAESIHASRFAFVLEQMDVTPEATPVAVLVRTTRENLRSAIEGEVFERVVAYERFKQYARDELAYEALAAFCYACNAEATHAAKLAEALVQLDVLASARAYYVCPGCGCVASRPCMGHCDCGESGKHFAVVYDTSAAPPTVLADRSEGEGQR